MALDRIFNWLLHPYRYLEFDPVAEVKHDPLFEIARLSVEWTIRSPGKKMDIVDIEGHWISRYWKVQGSEQVDRADYP
jgi:hypothetical protein